MLPYSAPPVAALDQTSTAYADRTTSSYLSWLYGFSCLKRFASLVFLPRAIASNTHLEATGTAPEDVAFAVKLSKLATREPAPVETWVGLGVGNGGQCRTLPSLDLISAPGRIRLLTDNAAFSSASRYISYTFGVARALTSL